MNEETVTISKSEYDRLMRDSVFLESLLYCVVDNLEGYSEARKLMREDEKSDE